jgi:glutamine cyclotransferase
LKASNLRFPESERLLALGTLPVAAGRVVRRLPHDPGAYTQGLSHADGRLIESTGGWGKSSLREVELETGRVTARSDLPRRLFGEGHARIGSEIISLTWHDGVALRWDASSLAPISTLPYPHEGWGLAAVGDRLLASDGSPTLRFLDPATLRETGQVNVSVAGRPLPWLNDLEWMDGEIWANVWQSDLLARIDAGSGEVTGWIDLRGLRALAGDGQIDSVLNGIAPGSRPGTFLVTGKNWNSLFEMALEGASP